MRISALALACIAAFALAACSAKSNTSSSTTTSSDTGTTTSSSGMTASTGGGGGGAATSGSLPSYPGATQEASGTSSGMGGAGSASGTVLSTSDSFDTVYHWYQSHMPAGSEKSHTSAAGMESAVFYIGNAGDQRSVTITTNAGKTMITIAHVTQ